jgi:class 3 adenylate cyclase
VVPVQKAARVRRLTLRAKIALSMALVAALVVGATLATSHYLRSAALLEEFQVFVRSIAGTAALALDPDDIATIRTADDPAFSKARAILDQTRRINGLDQQEIYILRPRPGGGPFEMEFLVMLQQKTFVGSPYTIPEATRSQLLQAWNAGVPTSTGIYTDAHGRWISGYAPLVSQTTGRAVGILEADAEVTRFFDKQRANLLIALAIGLGAFSVAMVPGFLLANSITRGLQTLSTGMMRFRSGEHDVQVTIATADEVEDLGSVFNEMILSLREKLALLPYVSRFTAEAVRRSRDDPSWLTGSQQDVTVLFADLRGFTRFSESREANVLVKELNQLLAVQADVVVSAGGDVDKFIGDAVMAVFIEEEDTAARVFECARRLLQRVRAETTSRGWTLGLGVGIHRGRAVVGSIGSETRRDFTAIGHTVNIASRLCDHAASWEVLVSEEFLRALPPAGRSHFRRTESLQLRNVQQAIATYRWNQGVSAESDSAKGDAVTLGEGGFHH